MKTKICLFISAVIILSLTPPARAELITIEIEAVVDGVLDEGNYLEDQISPGDIITGYYTYDSDTPDSNPLNSNVGDYWHYSQPCGIFLSVGGFDFQTDPTNVEFLVEIINDYISGGLHDSYGLRSYNNLSLSNGTSVYHIQWWLSDDTAGAISSDTIPTIAPSLEDWESLNFLRLEGEKGVYIVDAHVTSTVLVPEPTTLLFFALGASILRKIN